MLLWDRKAESGFPGRSCLCIIWRYLLHLVETKVLKQLVRDHIDPSRDLGHSDKHGKKKEEKIVAKTQDEVEANGSTDETAEVKRNPDGTVCEDCR